MITAPGPGDTYDPSPDGMTPATLAEVSAVGRRAADAAEKLLEALAACTTPMNMRPLHTEVEGALRILQDSAGVLEKAEQIVGTGTPVATRFAPGEAAWTEVDDERGGPVLSPKQLIGLARTAALDPNAEPVTYAAVMQERNPVPSIIRDRHQEAERGKHWAENEGLRAVLLNDMESRSCTSCGAEPGEVCVTGSGNVTGPHVARRKTSPLAAEHPAVAAQVRRVDPKYLRRT